MRVPAAVLIAVALVLGALEVVAILNREPGDTITERLRALLGIRPRRAWRPFGIMAVIGFCSWFAWHLLLEI